MNGYPPFYNPPTAPPYGYFVPPPGYYLAPPPAPVRVAAPPPPPPARAPARAKTTYITSDQAAAARAYIKERYASMNGVWPSNCRTAPELADACARIGITRSQLKHQFDKYRREITGRGAMKRNDHERAQYEAGIVKRLGDGTTLLDAAVAASKTEKLLDSNSFRRAHFAAIVDSTHRPDTLALSLDLLRRWAHASSIAWANGSNDADMLQFTLTRSALHPIFRSKLATPAGMARDPHIAGVLEGLLYEAYKKELRPADTPAI